MGAVNSLRGEPYKRPKLVVPSSHIFISKTSIEITYLTYFYASNQFSSSIPISISASLPLPSSPVDLVSPLSLCFQFLPIQTQLPKSQSSFNIFLCILCLCIRLQNLLKIVWLNAAQIDKIDNVPLFDKLYISTEKGNSFWIIKIYKK